jgi:hypothetical protein
MGETELDDTRVAGAQEPSLEVERLVVVAAPALLSVQQVGLADVFEDHLFAVGERLDRGVFAGADAAPRAEQERQRVHVTMQVGRHRGDRTTAA